jgi:hypothetical protein
VTLAACGSTTVEQRPPADESLEPIEGGVIVDDSVPVTSEPIAGTAADLLPEIGLEMSRLGSEIADEGDEQATLARIEQMWAAIEDEIIETRPELLAGIEATVEMARTAVTEKRPADADKAFSILTDLVDQYTGDG